MRRIRWRCRVRHASWSVVVFSAAPAAWAQAEATPPSEVQVIGTRAPAALGSVVSDVVVIDGDRIRASSADSIEDLLRR